RRAQLVPHPASQGTATVARGAAGVRVTAQGLVVADDAAGDGEHRPRVVENAAAMSVAAGPARPGLAANGPVVGHDDVGEGQVAEVQDAAARAGDAGRIRVGLAVGDRQPFDGHRGAGADVEDPAGVMATDSYLLAAAILVVMLIMVVIGHAFDRHVVGD